MRNFIQSYNRILHSRPILMQTIQTGVLMGAGDGVAQVFIEKKTFKEYNWARTGQFAIVGVGFLGPALTLWFRFLAKHVGTSGGVVTLKKVAIDQTCWAPVCIGTLLSLLGLVQGKPPKQTFDKLKRDYPDIMIANYKFWPAVQLFNFYVIPLNYQVLLFQFAAVFWNTYLSWRTQTGGSPSPH